MLRCIILCFFCIISWRNNPLRFGWFKAVFKPPALHCSGVSLLPYPYTFRYFNRYKCMFEHCMLCRIPCYVPPCIAFATTTLNSDIQYLFNIITICNTVIMFYAIFLYEFAPESRWLFKVVCARESLRVAVIHQRQLVQILHIFPAILGYFYLQFVMLVSSQFWRNQSSNRNSCP